MKDLPKPPPGITLMTPEEYLHRHDSPPTPEQAGKDRIVDLKLYYDNGPIRQARIAVRYADDMEEDRPATLVEQALFARSERGACVDGVDVPRAWPKEAMDGPKSEPEALVAWLDTARRFGAEEAIKIMRKRLDRLEELRNG